MKTTNSTEENSMTATVDLDRLELKHGSHDRRSSGVCLMEAVAWYASEKHSDMPACVSPVLRRYGINVNDRLPHERRQELKRFIPRLVGTAGDGRDAERTRIALEYVYRDFLPAWLDLAGLTDLAAELRAFPLDDRYGLRALARKARDASWELRRVQREQIRAEVEKHLKGRSAAADAAADAAAAAVAAAVAAAAAAAAAAAVGKYDTYGAAYEAAKVYTEAIESSAAFAEVRALRDRQRDDAFTLYDRLIDAPAAV